MGACLSDLKGGKQAVGGGGVGFPQTVTVPGTSTGNNGGGGANDAVDLFYTAQGFQAMFTRVELTLSACNLLDRDIASKSDPMVVVYEKKRDGILQELGRTEVIMNCLNPEWIVKVSVAFQFEVVQPLVFQVYDIDTKYHRIPVKTINLKDQDFLGEATCTLSEIVTKQSRSVTLRLQNRTGRGGLIRNLGAITVHAEETAAAKSAVEMIFRCSHLDNKDVFSKSDPFLRISRRVESGGSVPICKTEVIDNNLNPKWKPVCLSFQQFGSKDNPLVIECFDFNSSGDHVLIGKLEKSVADLEKLYNGKAGANFFMPSKHHRQDKVLKGQLFVDQFCEKEQFTFIDYISSGFELNFMVAVDFTASNGNPQHSNSLHYIDVSGRLNSYQKAIMEVGEVIQFYDSDKQFPAWGFGGHVPGGGVSHCFNLNGSSGSSEVVGVEGVMHAYATALRSVTLSGPTLFGPVINMASQMAAESLSTHNSTNYYVLLIITDGVVTDLQETVNSLVKASDLPLSILIVGVGNADFTNMEVLDADNGRRLESSTGRVATRDIVQFVPMREVQSGQISVVQALLEELPGQFLTFMRCRDIKPIPFGFPQA
ncbi:protein BONZAI 3 [Lotus japonicus]|uniref:protein BONZAI 3 n=1 Tax=Lotus japonicus TaxID=34305 RepID=UPI00258283C2|nr:protein BONZAI 3 [Lotus japonicus]